MIQRKPWIPQRNVQSNQKHLFSCSSSVRIVCVVFYQCIDCDRVCTGLPFRIKWIARAAEFASDYAFVQESQATCKLPLGLKYSVQDMKTTFKNASTWIDQNIFIKIKPRTLHKTLLDMYIYIYIGPCRPSLFVYVIIFIYSSFYHLFIHSFIYSW